MIVPQANQQGFTSRPSVPLITHSSPCLLGAIWFHSVGITLAWRHYISCCYLYLEQKQAFEFGFYVLLLSPVICSIMAFLRSLQVEEMALTSKSRKYGFVAWLVSTSVGLSLSFLSKSSVLLGISLTVPLMVACLSIAVPIWMHNGYQFWFPQLCGDQARDPRFPRLKGFLLWICVVVFVGSVMALGAIISSKPKLGFRPISGFPVVVKSRDDRLPTKGDFLAALLPLACIAALLSLCCGMIKWCMTISSRCLLNLTHSSRNRHPLSAFWPFFWVWSHSLLGGFKIKHLLEHLLVILHSCFCWLEEH
ncbi:unnamed protein product [Brassica oleracea]